MSDFLNTMASLSLARAEAAGPFTDDDLDKPLVPLQLGGFDIIAELKNRSPAEGELASTTANRVERAQQYVAGGAAAISVLTEPSQFAGSLEHLEEVAAALPETPVMRKDFLVDTRQILEARSRGASGVLLIAAMRTDDDLRNMLDCAGELGMFVLLECFDSADLERATALLDNFKDGERVLAGQILVGVNTRNLRTLHVDPNRLAELAPELPAAKCVAESGLHTPEDSATAADLGYRLGLVGTALMRSDAPAALVAAMREAGTARVGT